MNVEPFSECVTHQRGELRDIHFNTISVDFQCVQRSRHSPISDHRTRHIKAVTLYHIERYEMNDITSWGLLFRRKLLHDVCINCLIVQPKVSDPPGEVILGTESDEHRLSVRQIELAVRRVAARY